ncbi:MAG: transcription antitermination factor NusB [Elusimicrobiota bacterium]
MGRRRQAREFALQALYLAESGGMSVQQAMIIVSAGHALDKETLVFAKALAVGAHELRDELDKRIAKTAKNWALERMAAVDRNLLRLASYELMHCPDTPASVVIDEALEIAKVFAARESGGFINGILDKIRKSARKGKKP